MSHGFKKIKPSVDDFVLLQKREKRPWGEFVCLAAGLNYQCKWIRVKPGHRFSYQSHQCRDEHWVFVRGSGTVTLDGDSIQVIPGAYLFIAKNIKHRLENKGQDVLEMIEVQMGPSLSEEDIVRFDDDYGRC